MPVFRYKATNSTKKRFSGVVDADDLADARRRLESRGLTLISVQAAVLPMPRHVVAERAPRRWWPWLVLGLVLLAAVAGWLFMFR